MKIIVFIPTVNQNGHTIEDAIIVNEKVFCYINFDRSLPPLGVAILTKDESGVMYAEMDTSKLSGLYPAIGGVYNKTNIEIREIGICSQPNTDNRIKPIE